jgi:hypothetical protein
MLWIFSVVALGLDWLVVYVLMLVFQIKNIRWRKKQSLPIKKYVIRSSIFFAIGITPSVFAIMGVVKLAHSLIVSGW